MKHKRSYGEGKLINGCLLDLRQSDGAHLISSEYHSFRIANPKIQRFELNEI
jgi:hypothetical protein